MKKLIYPIMVALILSSCASNPASSDTIGTAKMNLDGKIQLFLIARSDDGARGHSYFEYSPNHPDYQKIVEHLGGIKAGEEKLVPAWK